MLSVNDLIQWRAESHPDDVALVDERGDRATYGELHDRMLDCGVRWLDRGINQGDVIALLDTNSVEFFVSLFGLSRIGAIPALMNWRLTQYEITGLFEFVEPVGVVIGPGLRDRLPDVQANSPRVVEAEHEQAAPIRGERTLLPPAPVASDVFALAFSSGTTGRPKAIPWRHESLVRSTFVDSADCSGMSVGSTHLLVAPAFHLAGMSNALMGLANGATIHLRAGFEPEAVLNDIESLGVEYMTVVPAMFRALTLAATQRSVPPDTSSLLEMTYGASPIAPELVRQVIELCPQTRLRQFYGMTEIAGALTTLRPADHAPGSKHLTSAGRVNPGFEVKLVDPTGQPVVDGLPGQIMIRGLSIMDGYWRDPEATARVLNDGWFASGDIAIRNQGYLTIMDRATDMIVTGGENVYPAEVEAAIFEYQSVVDVAVIGVPDEHWGERVHAVVVAAAGAVIELADLQAFLRDLLAGFKLPRSLSVVDELPRNTTGKILKRELRVNES